MTREETLQLMQHADGELDERELASARGQIERDADARTTVESLGQMTELVRGHLELSGDAVPDRRFGMMWRTIQNAIAVEPAIGVWARISSWLERYRGHLITGAVSAGAVAALALILRPSSEPVVVNSSPINVQPAALRSAPVIEDLETPGGNGTVLNIEDEEGHMTVIVVTPADTVEGI